jgi:DsbC/DsbD-like thiol-disulfide interchange protein
LFLEVNYRQLEGMKQILAGVFASFFCICPLSQALATATDWVDEAGARIRLIAAEPAAGDTEIKAALQIELKDGWKTYWRDPGDAGVPPQVSITGESIAGFELHYPAPERFHDGKTVWAGYKHMVAFPLTLRISSDAPKFAIKATTFLGICEDICIPVQNEFALEVPRATASTADQALVSSFFDALPGSASDGFKIGGLVSAGGEVKIELSAPKEASPLELFLASDGYMFGVPELVAEAGVNSSYSAKIIFAPKNSSGADVFYTIKSAKGAVSGTAALTVKP